MARKSRSRKRKAKKNSVKSVSSKVVSTGRAPKGESAESKTVEADVVIDAIAEETEPQLVVRPVIHPAEVIEIRPAEFPESGLPNDNLSLEGWDKPQIRESPLPSKEALPGESEDTLDALQSEIDVMLDDGSLGEAPLVYEEKVSVSEEPTRKRVHRFERKLQPVDRLPEELSDSESDSEEALGDVFSKAPKTMPETDAGSPWSDERAGGQGSPEKFFGRKNVLEVIEEIPLIGRVLVLVRDGAWRPSTVFVVIFSLINTLIFILVLSFMLEDPDRLRSFNEKGTSPEELAKSVPMGEIKACVKAFTVASTWEEKLKHVRAAGHVVEKLRAYYQTNPVRLGEDVIIERAERVVMNGLDLFKIEATVLPQKEALVLMIERDARGLLKVDWEVAVDYQEMPWKTFYEEQPTQPTNLRVVFRLQDPPYYNYQFGDPVAFRGYRLSYPKTGFPNLTGYVERGSELDKELEALLGGENVEQYPAILNVAYPKNPQDPAMVRITKMVSPGWVVDYEAVAHTSE